ncbi:MAG TPA: hypothetical protein VIV56_07235 [Gemmatimonadales bacterium]
MAGNNVDVAVNLVVQLHPDQFADLYVVLRAQALAQERTAAALELIHEYQRTPARARWVVSQPMEE